MEIFGGSGAEPPRKFFAMSGKSFDFLNNYIDFFTLYNSYYHIENSVAYNVLEPLVSGAIDPENFVHVWWSMKLSKMKKNLGTKKYKYQQFQKRNTHVHFLRLDLSDKSTRQWKGLSIKLKRCTGSMFCTSVTQS